MAVPHYEGKQRVVWMSSAQHSTLLIPEQVLDILLSIHSVPPGQLRHDPIPEKPPCGALFAVLKSPEEPLENDGHDWVDRAAVYTIAVREYEIEVLYNRQGLEPADTYNNYIQRHIYRISNSNLHLVHYSKALVQKGPIPKQAVADVYPSHGLAPPIQQHPDPGKFYKQGQQSVDNRHPKTSGNNEGVPYDPTNHDHGQDREEPPFTPEDYLVSNKHLAIARYKRNHEFMDQIFSQYHASAFLNTPDDVNNADKIKELKKLKDECDKEILELKKRHLDILTKHKYVLSQISKYLSIATECQSIEDLNNAEKGLLSSLSTRTEKST